MFYPNSGGPAGLLHERPWQRGLTHHDGAAEQVGVCHRCPEAPAVWPHRSQPWEQEPPQAAATQVRSIWEGILNGVCFRIYQLFMPKRAEFPFSPVFLWPWVLWLCLRAAPEWIAKRIICEVIMIHYQRIQFQNAKEGTKTFIHAKETRDCERSHCITVTILPAISCQP